MVTHKRFLAAATARASSGASWSQPGQPQQELWGVICHWQAQMHRTVLSNAVALPRGKVGCIHWQVHGQILHHVRLHGRQEDHSVFFMAG
jgi:hypothetical protein